MNMKLLITYDEFKKKIDNLFKSELEVYFDTVDYADHLINKQQGLDEKYYLRHRIETVKRIRMTTFTDSLALSQISKIDYDLARKWGLYTIQEMNHDKMFLTDIKKHDLSSEYVHSIEPFQATKNMGEYLTEVVSRGEPLGALGYSLFVEWNSDQYSPAVVEKAEEKYSAKHVKGSKAHVKFDVNEDHLEMIFQISYALLKSDAHFADFIVVLKNISRLFREYFQELYEYAIVDNNQVVSDVAA